MLVKVIPGHDTQAETAMKTLNIPCTVVFGPYDYILEFPVDSIEGLATRVSEIRSRLSGIAATTMSMATIKV